MGIMNRIGTPLSKSATRVTLLGCGELGKEVIIALQRLGCEVTVIGVDRYPDAPDLPVDTALRRPGGSAVIYGGLEQKGIAFEGVAEALQLPESDLRLFGKPESFVKRRMGVAVASADTTDEARTHAKLAASRVKPVKE